MFDAQMVMKQSLDSFPKSMHSLHEVDTIPCAHYHLFAKS